MKQYNPLLKKLKLFYGIEAEDIESILKCQNSYIRFFEKKETVLLAGDTLSDVHIVLDGKVAMFQESFDASRHLYAYLTGGDFFGEHAVREKSYVSVFSYQAVTDCTILYMNWEKIIHICPNNCHFHKAMICNMLDIFMGKNSMLMEKLEVLSRKTIREKLLSYFYQQAVIQNSSRIKLPFSRTELANYLSVNRSAMTRELTAMINGGRIDFHDGFYFIK